MQPPNQQGLDIQSTPRAEMNLYPLDTFPYEFPGREIKIKFEIPEFTCVCPFSDFPDFATIRLEYAPNERCVELKSLKLYSNWFRGVKVCHEARLSFGAEARFGGGVGHSTALRGGVWLVARMVWLIDTHATPGFTNKP